MFPTLLEELTNLLGGLAKKEWDNPTICTPWSVKDVCLHLLGGDIGNLSWKRDGFSVFNEIESYENLVQLVNDHNAHWVKSSQHISPKLLIDMLKFTGEQVTEYFHSLDPFEPGISVSWVGKPGLKEARFLAPILDTFILALPRTFRTVAAEEGAVIQISTRGTVSREWILLYGSDIWQLFEGVVENPLAGLSIPDDIAWRVFTKGITLEDARSKPQFQAISNWLKKFWKPSPLSREIKRWDKITVWREA